MIVPIKRVPMYDKFLTGIHTLGDNDMKQNYSDLKLKLNQYFK